MKNLIFIFISLSFSLPPSFNLNRNNEIINTGLPDNGIIDIEAVSSTEIYLGTPSGLGKVIVDGDNKFFSSVNNT